MKAILTDTTKCIGCRECVIACKKRYDLEDAIPRKWSARDGLSARNWTSIIDRPDNKYIRKQCRHCLEPACVSACPVGALKKNKDGAVTYISDLCMGCRYCMMTCPYGIPRYDWDQQVPLPLVTIGIQPLMELIFAVQTAMNKGRSDLYRTQNHAIRAILI